jgi:hypothetical protein
MAIQQLDLGAVYNTLAQKRTQDLQAQQFAQQGQMNALQMARYQRENATEERKQSALSRLISLDPNDTEGRRSALFEAAPEYAAKQEAARLFPTALTGKDRYLEGPDGIYDLAAPGGPRLVAAPQILDGETAPVSVPQARPTLAPGGRGPVPMPGQSRPYSEGVRNVENTTGNPNAKNPNSSATGDGQFIESTWLDMMSRKAPGLVQGKSREEILAMRSDPDLSAKMTEEYALDNQRIFERNGIQATPALLYGAHHFGAGAAVKFAKAPDETPMEAILGPDAIKANPQLAGVTVGQAKARLEQKFAGVAMPGQQPQQAAPQQETPQSAGDEGWSRVRNLKGAGIAQEAPAGMQWVGRRRPDGSIETKVAPIPGAPDDRADKRADENFDQETKLRTEHQNLVKGFDVAQTNFATMPELAADETGGSDIALVNAFFKTFAPDSTVMEGEFASAAKAGGVPDRIVGLIDKALTGQMLTPQQRQELTTAAGRFYNQRKVSVEGANEKYTKLAKSYPGINSDRVVINPIRDLPKYEPKPKEEKKVAEVAAAPPALEGRTVGQTYQTPRGPAIWRGNGWELTK